MVSALLVGLCVTPKVCEQWSIWASVYRAQRTNPTSVRVHPVTGAIVEYNVLLDDGTHRYLILQHPNGKVFVDNHEHLMEMSPDSLICRHLTEPPQARPDPSARFELDGRMVDGLHLYQAALERYGHEGHKILTDRGARAVFKARKHDCR